MAKYLRLPNSLIMHYGKTSSNYTINNQKPTYINKPPKKPKLQLISTDLDTINNIIKKILTKRDFDKKTT